MLIEKIILNNIRTYTNETIELEEASILLSGDIGSGKSSILLAIEFALFGIARGKLSGESLLRKGTDEGSVEMHFKVNGQPFTIKRKLKKSSLGVQQVSGELTENGETLQLTPVELKSKILTILGYPLSTLKSAKNFTIFRYTVYTPQEEMKHIITDAENRLDVLREVFNIDKYKLIKKNCELYVRSLDKELIQMQEQTSKFPEKSIELESLKKQKEITNNEIRILQPELDMIKQEKVNHDFELQKLEYDIQKRNLVKEEFNIKENELKNIIQNISRNNESITNYKERIERDEKELNESVEEINYDEKIREHSEKIQQMDKQELEKNKILATFKAKIQNSEEILKKINSLDNCPLCMQDVTEEHKHSVVYKEDEKITHFNEEINKLQNSNFDTSKLKEELEILRNKKNKFELLKSKKGMIEEIKKDIQKLEENNQQLKEKVGIINEEKLKLNERLAESSNLEENYSKLKEKGKLITEKELTINRKQGELKTKIEFFDKDIQKLEEEIKEMLLIKLKLKKKLSTKNWLKSHFIHLMELIEKHVMLKIQQEFDEYFQEWFNMLIEDENIQARLDEKFTPIIEQDGYEIEFSDLSGGEKTSVALAYKLALNKVINDLISNIKTKDFIILDEPTDGFSSEQLDKIKDILEEIDVKQMVIVSHESKIETFVEKVIKIEKNNNISNVV